jgi:hypothetical protein
MTTSIFQTVSNIQMNILKKQWPPIAGSILFYLFSTIVSILAILSIVWFVRRMTRVSSRVGNVYEHFEASSADGLLVEYTKRIPQIRAIKEQLEHDMETLNDLADDTCNIMAQIQDTYVGNTAAPSDEEEYNLPQAQQKKLQENRRRRGILRFEEEKKQYMALNQRKTILECFSADANDLAEAEQTLSDEVSELLTIIDSAEVRIAAEKGEKIDSLLGFNAKYLKKALDTATVEGFFQELKGTALIAKADELIGKAITVHDKLVILKKKVAQQKLAVKSLTVQAANLEKGNISPVIADIAISKQLKQ